MVSGISGNVVVTVVFQKDQGRCRLSALNLAEDGPVPAEDALAALVSAADELKFQMRLAREQGAAQQGETVLPAPPSDNDREPRPAIGSRAPRWLRSACRPRSAGVARLYGLAQSALGRVW